MSNNDRDPVRTLPNRPISKTSLPMTANPLPTTTEQLDDQIEQASTEPHDDIPQKPRRPRAGRGL
jgi:hypothetical protein